MSTAIHVRTAVVLLGLSSCEHVSRVDPQRSSVERDHLAGDAVSSCVQLRPEPPKPATAPVAARPSSLISASIPFELASIAADLDRLIPNLSDPSWPTTHKVADGLCATWSFVRAPVALSTANDRLLLSIPGGFGMIADPHVGFANVGCTQPFVSCGNINAGVPAIPISVHLSAPLTLDAGYRFSGVIANGGTVFAQPCQVAFGIVNATPTVRGIIDAQVDRQLGQLNAMIAAKSDFRPQASALWNALQQPRRVAGDLWLIVRPRGAAAALRTSTPTQISAQLALWGDVELVQSASPPAVAVVALPDLTSPPAMPSGARLRASGSLDYAVLSEGLRRFLVGQEQRIADAAGVAHVVTVRDVRVSGPVSCLGGGACLELAIRLDGEVCGIMYLVGRPDVDDAKQEIVVRDLELSVETSDSILNAAVWLRHGDLVNKISHASHFSIAAAINRINAALGTQVRFDLLPGLQLAGNVSGTTLSLTAGVSGVDYTVEVAATLEVVPKR